MFAHRMCQQWRVRFQDIRRVDWPHTRRSQGPGSNTENTRPEASHHNTPFQEEDLIPATRDSCWCPVEGMEVRK